MAVFICLAGPAFADVKLHALFSDHMVLQCDMEVPVWGRAEPGEKVTVEFAGQNISAVADAKGQWIARLTPLAASSESRDMTVSGKNKIVLRDVLVGEVWLASGQSNMFWPVLRALNGQKEAAEANYPLMRLFQVPSAASSEPRAEVATQWAVCSPESARDFSAVAFYFGRHLHKELKVPVGLVHASIRGTSAEVWMSQRSLEAAGSLAPVLSEWKAEVAKWNMPLYPDPQKKAYEYWQASLKGLADYMRRWTELKKKGEKNPQDAMPKEFLVEYEQHQKIDRIFKKILPSGFFNGMIYPLIPYGIRGAIWYQGEANVDRANSYRDLLCIMIGDWRKYWGQGEFPFLVVGLANYLARADQPGDSGWARLREAQYGVQNSITNAGFANTIDLGEEKNVHYKNKQDVGLRLALVALAKTYGRQVEFSGPVFSSMEKTKEGLMINFKHAAGLNTAGGGAPGGFAVAGDDKKWHWAKANITNNSVLLTCDSVKEPVAARYAWADNPEVNLYNGAKLPAVPFRTDDWPRDNKTATKEE
jgi:sialate O-acetylesterase